jgi:uncharacterized protein DUF4168
MNHALKGGIAAAAILLAFPLIAAAQPSTTTSPTPPPAATTPAPSTTAPSTTPSAEPSSPAMTAAPTTPAAPASYTDAQLRSFSTAATAIEPISRGITASSTAEQRTQASTQIRAILQRNNLDSTTYNAIAAQAHTDTALAARIRTLSASSSPSNSPG